VGDFNYIAMVILGVRNTAPPRVVFGDQPGRLTGRPQQLRRGKIFFATKFASHFRVNQAKMLRTKQNS
jgi:hypothetical protein